MVKEQLGLVTVLGLSNISHGMPKRPWLNQAFLAQAVAAGLDAVIANPMDDGLRKTLAAASYLAGRDPNGNRYIEQTRFEYARAAAELAANMVNQTAPAVASTIAKDLSASAASGTVTSIIDFTAGFTSSGGEASHQPQLVALHQAIAINDRHRISELLQALAGSLNFLSLTDRGIIPVLEQTGNSFAKGETFLPQLLLAADGAAYAFERLKSLFPAAETKTLETVVLGSVAGDIHDIGKNIVKALLASYGYNVVDLGKNVPTLAFVDAVREHKAEILGLSALMTTTMVEMAPVIQAVRQAGLEPKILVGGAVLTQGFAQAIQADAYVKDGSDAHSVIRRLLDARLLDSPL
jgi:5-methyltetrahydrofolate--homocysteine methyltransferase